MDMLATDQSASEISDKIKEILFTKSAEKIDAAKPDAATSLFGREVEADIEDESGPTNEIDPEEESND